MPEQTPVRMNSEAFARLLREARSGCKTAMGELLELFRPFLLATAQGKLPADMRARVGSSELVQKTFMNAGKEIANFRGVRRAELVAWLRAILNNELKAEIRFQKAKKRDLTREVRKTGNAQHDALEELATNQSTPSRLLIKKESLAKLRASLARLLQDCQQVIQLRNFERLAWKEIGERLGRSAESARKLWARSVVQLQQVMSAEADSHR
jgi:RNA polymerase sigma-70 factor (ECF subfamily)